MWTKQVLTCSLILGLIIVGCQTRTNNESLLSTPTAVFTTTPEIGVELATLTSRPLISIENSPDPVPTTTPVPSATPRSYIVQEGDTLFEIASNLGITVDEILSLNPGIEPELIRVGQNLIIPDLPIELSVTRAAEQSPALLEVVKIAHYRMAQGNVWVLGEVMNQNDLPVTNVQVEIAIENTQTNVETRFSVWVVPSVIPPGKKAPFGLLLNTAPQEFKITDTHFISGQVLPDLGNQYLDLAVQDATVTIDESNVEIRGLVTNEGHQTAREIWLVTTLYDDQENVTGYLQIMIPGSLAAYGNVPFQLEVTAVNSRTTDFSYIIQALIEPIS